MARAKRLLVAFALIVIGITIFLYLMAGIRPASKPATLGFVKLPPGFSISIFASGFGGSPISQPGPNPGARLMLYNNGTLYVSIPSQGKIVSLRDSNGDWVADEEKTFIEGLNKPHGIDYSDGWFYIAEEDKVIRTKDSDGDGKTDGTQVLVTGIPTGGHFTRTVKVFNNSLFVSAGSSCNVCREESPWRAAITKCNLDGSNCTVFASGLRNAVGIVFHPVTGELYATENGRDLLGDDLPPDEINLVKEGGDYGWPMCYGKKVRDFDFDSRLYEQNPCGDTQSSLVDLQAHSAPLGLAIYTGNSFPKEYLGDLFVAYHGSWNREEPTGYKIVSIDLETKQVKDFATGWLEGGSVLGRPVDVINAPDGSLFVSDDNAGRIYRISYAS